MVRGTLIALTALLLACGGGSQEGSTAAPDAAESGGSSEASSVPAGGDTAEAGNADASAAQRCFTLMSDRDYEGAVTVCAQALELEPSNIDVEHALAKAKSEVASAAYNAADKAKDAEAAAGKLLE